MSDNLIANRGPFSLVLATLSALQDGKENEDSLCRLPSRHEQFLPHSLISSYTVCDIKSRFLHYATYTGVILSTQHRPISKLARQTNHVDRFNSTLRQLVSRLVHATLSFSKKLTNHIEAIKYFICNYNFTKCAALLESH